MLDKITKVEVIDDYTVRCYFLAGAVRDYNLSRQVFSNHDGMGDLIDMNEFRKVKVKNSREAIVWDNGSEFFGADIIADGILVEWNTPSLQAQFARLMTYYRLLNGLTQKQLEALTGIHQADLSKYEKGEGNISFDTMKRICKPMGVTPHITFDGPKDIVLDENAEAIPEILQPYLSPNTKQGNFIMADLGDIPDDIDQFVELINGVVLYKGIPGITHQEILSYLMTEFSLFIKDNSKCKVLWGIPFVLNDKTYVVPDLSIICPDMNDSNNTNPLYRNNGNFVIEVVSPGPENKSRDYFVKANIYTKAKVREYWIIDPISRYVITYSDQDDYLPHLHTMSGKLGVGIYDDKLEIDLDEIGKIISK